MEFLDRDYEWFKKEFYKLTTIQLDFYKEKQMKRRINTLIEKKGLDGYEAYINLLFSNEKELSFFVDYITINVTEFFRTYDHWKYLENEIVPKLIASGDRIRIWCSACSSGEEPYSVAMSLLNFLSRDKIEIFATDIDDTILEKARRGVFDDRAIASLPDEYRNRYFTKQGSLWNISEEIKSCVNFRKLDLLKDEYPKACDLILCRNVLIYFTEEAKEIVYTRFRDSLKSEGYLFTGDTEQIVYHKLYGFKKEKNFLYVKYGDNLAVQSGNADKHRLYKGADRL